MDAYLSEIRTFAFGIVPRGWAVCNGALLSISGNQALFALLGTLYGGNGTTNFALPDFRGRAMLGTGSYMGATYPQGSAAGSANVTLNSTQMPAHNHMLRAYDGLGSTPLGNADDHLSQLSIFTGNQQSQLYASNGYTANPANLTPLQPNSIAATGGNQPHNNMQPYLAMNVCIAIQGYFPTRN